MQNESSGGGLILSLFSGVGALDVGFQRAGYCVVSAGDIAFSSLFDVREFHPPPGVFDGVIGGDPCQAHSTLAHLVRAKGLEPRFPDMTQEFSRVVEEARPRFFFRENVPRAPDLWPSGYAVTSFLLDHSTMDSGDGTGHGYRRRRRFWFGVQGDEVPELRAHLDFAHVVEPSGKSLCGDGRAAFIPGGQAEVDAIRRGEIPKVERTGEAGAYTIEDMLDIQGLPRNLFEHSPLMLQGKRELIGNAVPLPMAIALGQAVRRAMTALTWSTPREDPDGA